MDEKIARFWQTVVAHEALFAVPDNGKEEQMNEALHALQDVDDRLYFHIGYRDSGADLLISAEGHYCLAQTMSQIASGAPKLVHLTPKTLLDANALFGERNSDLFPDDENGDVLFRIAKRGGDLLSEHAVDFAHVFPTEDDAAGFANHFKDGDTTEPESYTGRENYAWQVTIFRQMTPSHANISGAEKELADLAAQYQGIPDGWGFMTS